MCSWKAKGKEAPPGGRVPRCFASSLQHASSRGTLHASCARAFPLLETHWVTVALFTLAMGKAAASCRTFEVGVWLSHPFTGSPRYPYSKPAEYPSRELHDGTFFEQSFPLHVGLHCRGFAQSFGCDHTCGRQPQEPKGQGSCEDRRLRIPKSIAMRFIGTGPKTAWPLHGCSAPCGRFQPASALYDIHLLNRLIISLSISLESPKNPR